MTSTAADGRHYAVRRVSPFEGVLQVVEIAGARAYSANGRSWQVQVRARRPEHTWRSVSEVQPVEQFFHFGLWDAVDGLQRVRANPVLDIGAMTAAAQRLSAALTALMPRLPFPLVDDCECWATDRRGRPVALLATTEEPQRIHTLQVGRWQASRPDDHGFVSPSLLERGLPAHGDQGPRQHAERLERQVNRRADEQHWYRCRPDGTRVRLDRDGRPAERASASFPPLGLTTDWPDAASRGLATDYLAWQAPRLLLLQALDDDRRRWLERQARRRAVELAAHFRLIPRILDRDALEAARVEARLRRAAD